VRTATLVLTDDRSALPHVVTLSGTATAAEAPAPAPQQAAPPPTRRVAPRAVIARSRLRLAPSKIVVTTTGRVAVQVKTSGRRTVSTRGVTLHRDCTYTARVAFSRTHRITRRFRIFVTFEGPQRADRPSRAAAGAPGSPLTARAGWPGRGTRHIVTAAPL
jgi:hypothetical protein